MSYPVEPFILAIDPGNSHVKYVSPFASGHFPSVYAIEEPGIDFDGLASANDFVIELAGQRYAIGHSAARLGNISVRTLDRSRVLSPDYKILIAAALVSALPYGGLISPVLNLPVAWYDRRDEVRKYLGGLWTITCQGTVYEYEMPPEMIRIVPEGFGTVCADSLDDQGRATNNGLSKKRVGVIDVGMRTTDLSFFDELLIVPAKTRGFDVGLSQALNMIQRLAERELGHNYTIEELDAAINGGALYHGPDDIGDKVQVWKDQALQQVANAVIGDVRSLWQGGLDAQVLLLTGGGGKQIMPYMLDAFPHLQPVQNPPMSNVAGAFLYALMKARQHGRS